MKYIKEDIQFEQISPRGFENLCYDLLVKLNFENLIWREGGADNGRDIEASFTFKNTIKIKETKWFFECKHYNSVGVPPEHLNSKIAWADAELPNSLVIFASSYLTNNARTWLEKISHQKQYEIICIEGEELKQRLLNYPDLIERYFSLNRYGQMLKDITDYKNKFNIKPSFEMLKEIIENIDITKLDNDDIGFILLNFFGQYSYFESRNDIYGDFDDKIINRVLEHLKSAITNESLSSFEEYRGNYQELAGTGILDEMNWLKDKDYIQEMKKYDFQVSDLHINHEQAQKNWKIGLYLFIIYDNVAFEIFKVDKTEIRIIKDFNPKKIGTMCLNSRKGIEKDYDKYLKQFNTQH
jgi:Restriction endonuclease